MNRAFHPILISVLPVLQILSVNRDMLGLSAVIFPSLFALAIGLIFWTLLGKYLGGYRRAAFSTSVILLFLFLYSPLQSFFADLGLKFLSRNSVLLPFFAIVFVVIIFAAWKKRKSSSGGDSIQSMNVFAILLCVLPLLSSVACKGDEELGADLFDLPASQVLDKLPNVYWIVLDAYAREDLLLDRYSFDNGEFISELRRRGFAVNDTAMSNYSQTTLSLASMLNSRYLDQEAAIRGAESQDRRTLTKLIKNNRLAESLSKVGYKSVTFSTGYSLTEDPGADFHFPSRHFLGRNPVNGLLLNRTPFKLIIDRFLRPASGHVWHRDRVIDNFEGLKSLVEFDSKPFFAFAHFVSPHQPYIFRKDGKFVPPQEPFSMSKELKYSEDPDDLYIEQLQFINLKLKETIRHILDNESVPPIIIIQSDHGPIPGKKERFKILHGLFLQGQPVIDLRSPVNTGRIIINQIFGTNIDLLADHAYWSSYEQPYNFEEVH